MSDRSRAIVTFALAASPTLDDPDSGDRRAAPDQRPVMRDSACALLAGSLANLMSAGASGPDDSSKTCTMATATDDHIASGRRTPTASPRPSRPARPQFRGLRLAIIADHGIRRADPPRGNKRKVLRSARSGAGYLIEGGGGQRGYTPFGIETAKGAAAHDLKEFWHVGRDLPSGHRFRDHMPDNVWPAEVASFRDTFEELYAAFETAGLKILKAIARFLKIDEDYFIGNPRK